MEIDDNPNVITLDQVSEEEGEMLISKETVYAPTGRPCPWCSHPSLEEQTYGYEKVVFCTHCEYTQTKNLG